MSISSALNNAIRRITSLWTSDRRVSPDETRKARYDGHAAASTMPVRWIK